MNINNLEQVEQVANAILYEGYILYPYRASSVKNRQRWNFGALCPESYSLAQHGTEAFSMQTECLVLGNSGTALNVKVRFLHLLAKEIGELKPPFPAFIEGQEPDFNLVGSLEIGGKVYQPWQEAVEREVSIVEMNLETLFSKIERRTFNFAAKRELEPLPEQSGQVAGLIIRTQQSVNGTVEITVEKINHECFKVTVSISNGTPLEEANLKSRDEAMLSSLVSTHTILTMCDGEFVSLLDPPDTLKDSAAACKNVGTWPVLAGEEGTRDCILSSPIILYDYPRIAPESAGDLFDGTEIDEILTLRIMTLTDDEKREIRGGDERARRLLERTETLPLEQMMKLHGAMRNVAPTLEDEQ